MKSAAALLAVLATALLAVAHASAYPWPVRPFAQQHPIRGNFDDPRMLRGLIDIDWDNPKSFHSGVDIQARDGTPVYAIRGGIASGHGTAVSVASPYLSPVAPVIFGYWHVDRVVSDSQYVSAGQLLGYVHKGAGHVHLSELRFGRYVNPLRRGGLTPYVDRTQPVLKEVDVYRAGTTRKLDPAAVSGRIDIVLDATDPPPLAPWGGWSGVVLSPERISWRGLFDGSWLPLGFRRLGVDFSAFQTEALDDVYAFGTRQNAENSPGVFRYWLARGLDTDLLADGPHAITISASDVRDNTTTQVFRFNVGAPTASAPSP
jgi:hypothetical protein